MASSLLKLGALGTVVLATPAFAVGFGEITLHSRMGEALRAEVPIIGASGEAVDGACYSLAPLPGADLPVVASARTRLLHEGGSYRLLITGSHPIAEPVFMIGVRAHCGIDLQRDYVLMPAEPLMTADPVSAPAIESLAPAGRAGNYRVWQASAGDTLESIAETLAPDDLRRQRRLLGALKRANPDLVPEQPLAAGERIRVPDLRQPRPAERTKALRPRPPRPSPAAPTLAPAAKSQAKPASTASGGDRIVLGAPPEDTASSQRPPARANAAELEERIARLETTLQQLNQEIDKLNKVLELSVETMAAQQKLQMAQALQSRAADQAGLPQSQPTPPAEKPVTHDSWLELLLGALLGGAVAATLANLLGRRRERQRRDEGSLLSSPPMARTPARPTAGETAPGSAAAPSAAVDLPTAANSSPAGSAEAMAVDFNETASALELAEIMLSYGRVKGAAETLAQHIEQNSPDNVQPWLMLLDLYRRGNMQAEFDDLAPHVREKFNMEIPSWDDSTTPVSGLKALESYAHIIWRLEKHWGHQECLDYLYDLIHDSRAGQRHGFPLEVVEEIALLMQVLETGYGLKRPS